MVRRLNLNQWPERTTLIVGHGFQTHGFFRVKVQMRRQPSEKRADLDRARIVNVSLEIIDLMRHPYSNSETLDCVSNRQANNSSHVKLRVVNLASIRGECN